MALQDGGSNYEWLAALGAGVATAFAWFAWFVKRTLGKPATDPVTRQFLEDLKKDCDRLEKRVDTLTQIRGQDAERIARLEGRLSRNGLGKLEEEPATFKHNVPTSLKIVK